MDRSGVVVSPLRCCRLQCRDSFATVLFSMASSATVCVVLFSLSTYLSFTKAAMFSNKNTVNTAFYLAQPLVLVIFMAIAVYIMMKSIYLSMCEEPSTYTFRQARPLYFVILLSGLALYGLGSILLDVILAVRYSQCQEAVALCSNSLITAIMIVSFLTIPSRLLYVIAAFVFCLVFSFRAVTWNLRFKLTVLIAAALSLCINAVVDEAASMNPAAQNETWNRLQHCTVSNVTNSRLHECIIVNTTINHVYQQSQSYLYPAVIQFLLLHIQVLVCSIYGALSLGQSSGELTDMTAISPARSPYPDHQNHDDTVSLVRSDEFDTRACPPDCNNTRYLTLISTVLTILVMAVFYAVLLWQGIEWAVHKSSGPRLTYTVLSIVRWISLLLSAVVAMAVTLKFAHSRNLQPTGFEYYVIACALGPLFYCWFTIFSNSAADNVNVFMDSKLTICEESLNFAQILVQLIFYFYCKNVKFTGPGFRSVILKRIYFRVVLITYTVGNFAVWIENITLAAESIKGAFQRALYSEDLWPYLYCTFSPLLALYRFNSLLIFLQILQEFK